MTAETIERGALDRENAPVRIGRRMGPAENIERLLGLAVVGQRPAPTRQYGLVARTENGGAFEHRDGLGALPDGAQRLTVLQRRIGIPGVGTEALAIDIDRVPGIGLKVRLGLGARAERTCDIRHARGLAAAETHRQDCCQGRGSKKPGGGTGLLTHGTFTHNLGRSRKLDCLSNRLLTLTSG